jgi:hypothetical protein
VKSVELYISLRLLVSIQISNLQCTMNTPCYTSNSGRINSMHCISIHVRPPCIQFNPNRRPQGPFHRICSRRSPIADQLADSINQLAPLHPNPCTLYSWLHRHDYVNFGMLRIRSIYSRMCRVISNPSARSSSTWDMMAGSGPLCIKSRLTERSREIPLSP